MAISTLDKWEVKQIKTTGCNFFSPNNKTDTDNVLGEKQTETHPVGFCVLKGICRGKTFCPFWKN